MLISGLLEQTVKDYAAEFAGNSGHPQFERFLDRRTRRSHNLRAETLVQALGDFDGGWATQLEPFLDTRRRTAVDSVNANRNRIAHGLGVSLGLAQMNEWGKAVDEVIDQLAGLFVPNPNP